MKKIECKSEPETAIWAAMYGAEFVARSRDGDLHTRAFSALSAANAAVEAFRDSTSADVDSMIERLKTLDPKVLEAFAVSELSKVVDATAEEAEQQQALSEAMKQSEWQSTVDNWIKDMLVALDEGHHEQAHCLCDAVRTLKKVGRL